MAHCDYVCRKATPHDDIAAIAKYIHLTDPYIYPVISESPTDQDWCRLIKDCYTTPSNVFFYKHLTVVEKATEIVGVACVIECGQVFTFAEDVNVPESLSIGTAHATDGYFVPLFEENQIFEGFNIVNVCVDEAERGKGVGSLLMQRCVEEYGHKDLHLDVIGSNESANALYAKFGFRKVSEYMGFSGNGNGLLCYHMLRKAKG